MVESQKDHDMPTTYIIMSSFSSPWLLGNSNVSIFAGNTSLWWPTTAKLHDPAETLNIPKLSYILWTNVIITDNV